MSASSRVASALWALMLTAALFFSSSGALHAQDRGNLAGTVTDSAGGGISGAEVTVSGTTLRAFTDSVGLFRLQRVPAGDVNLQVRRLGYAPRTVPVTVAGGSSATANVRLAAVPYALDAITVRQRREVFDARLAGFNTRRQRGVGYFLTREQLDQKSHRLADVLREIPGVRIRPIPGAGRTVSMRGNCPALVVIDGTPATAGAFDLDMLDLASFEAVEVYSSSSTVPHELSAGRGTLSCGVVALWSRPARPREVGRNVNRAGDVRQMVESGRVFAPDVVEKKAELIGANAPVYPESMWNQGIGGRVTLEFIVDERGDVELGTVATVASTDPAFAAAARAVLASARFKPAVHQGVAVRQLVHLPIEFRMPAAGEQQP